MISRLEHLIEIIKCTYVWQNIAKLRQIKPQCITRPVHFCTRQPLQFEKKSGPKIIIFNTYSIVLETQFFFVMVTEC